MTQLTVLLSLALLACGTPATMGDDTAPDAAPSADAPVFLNFGTNVATITQDEAVTFTAVLTDPQGIDDLIGGSLTSEDGAIQYGAFATSGQEGSYTLNLTWDAIDQAADITFAQSATRTFTATFFDVAGHRVDKTVTITLSCGGFYACHGACANVCGLNSMTRGSCDAACASDQMTCDPGDTDRRAFYGTPSNQSIYGLATCASVPPATSSGQPFRLVECLCIPTT